jgi:hypothetical protein
VPRGLVFDKDRTGVDVVKDRLKKVVKVKPAPEVPE